MTTDPGGSSPLPARCEGVDDRGEVHYRVLSVKAIWWAAGLIVVVGVGVAVRLLLAYGRGGEQARNQLEAIKTAGTIVVGAGGAAALHLAARRKSAGPAATSAMSPTSTTTSTSTTSHSTAHEAIADYLALAHG